MRSRWAAVGAAVAITLGAGGVGLVAADVASGERAVFVPVTPCRIIDTRPAFQVGPRAAPLGTAETHTVSAHGTNGDCALPADAVGLSLNVTAVGATLPTFLTIWAAGESMPNASSLNPHPGQPPTPNAVITELSSGGQFNIYNLQGDVHVLADVNGYYADHHHDDRYYTEEETDSELAALTSRLVALESDVVQVENDLGARVKDLELAQPFAATARTAAVDLGVTGVSTDEYVVVSLQVTPPVAGHLTVNSTLAVEIDDPISGAAPPWTSLQCSITTGTTLDADYVQDLNREKTDLDKDQLSGTRVLAVAGGKSVDVNLVCEHDTLFTRARISDATLTAVFTPAP